MKSVSREANNTILLVASNRDTASLNIRNQILDHYQFKRTSEAFQENPAFEANFSNKIVKLVTLQEESIRAQNLPNSFINLELVIFISRHSSVSGTPTLSVHTPGNLGEAEFGGFPRKVSVSPASAMRDALIVLKKLKDEMQLAYEVSYECTHHGPSLSVPTMFAELGSSPEQWKDQKAAEAVAHAAIAVISSFGESKAPAVLGIGGQHYNAKFTRLALEENVVFGHMIPKYALPYVDSEIIKQCIAKTLERVESVLLDWKGIKGEDKPSLLQSLDEIGIPFSKV